MRGAGTAEGVWRMADASGLPAWGMRHRPCAVRAAVAGGLCLGLLLALALGVAWAGEPAAGPADPECLGCHGDPALTRAQPGERARTMYVDPAVLRRSRHARVPCTGCHAGIAALPHAPKLAPATCGGCHPREARAYAESVHGRAVAKSGLAVAPTCTGCHGTHSLTPADEPDSPVNRANVAETCGRCHQGILTEYRQSIHGVALAKGVREAPTCTDCHGEHTIAAPSDPASKVAPRNIPKTCGACHEAAGIVARYGLPAKRGETYADSFHGIAVKYGNLEAANCASCHGFHDIRPSSDPRSRIAKANLPGTCGKCHPGAGARFTEGRVHFEKTRESAPGVFYVRRFYTWFIGALMVCFLGYMAIEVYGYRRRRQAGRDRGDGR